MSLGRVPVEIQVRTHLQHAWAEIFEKLGDLFGRQIRYGQPADYSSVDLSLADELRGLIDTSMPQLSEVIDRVETAEIQLALVLDTGPKPPTAADEDLTSVQKSVQEARSNLVEALQLTQEVVSRVLKTPKAN
jgi:hypothetical protein